MAKEKKSSTQEQQAGTSQANKQAEIPGQAVMIKAQYLKDLSFESPNVPHILAQAGQPQIALSINIDVQPLHENSSTVTLHVKCESTIENNPQFIVEIFYEAVAELHADLDEKYHQPILMAEVPRYIFPFVRNVLADTTREGGFPPLFLQPIDFGDLYRKKLQQTINDETDKIPLN